MKCAVALLLFVSLFSCKKPVKQPLKIPQQDSASAMTNFRHSLTQEKIDPYDYDTLLTGGYHLSYRVYKDISEGALLQSLVLVKGNRDIKQLNETNYPTLHKNLGYIGANFGDAFAFVQSYGSGNPHEFQLIEKKSGKEITNGAFIDARDEEGILLYIHDLFKDTEQVRLLDLKQNRERVIVDFRQSKCVNTNPGGIRYCLEIDTVTTYKVILKVDNEEELIVKKYPR